MMRCRAVRHMRRRAIQPEGKGRGAKACFRIGMDELTGFDLWRIQTVRLVRAAPEKVHLDAEIRRFAADGRLIA